MSSVLTMQKFITKTYLSDDINTHLIGLLFFLFCKGLKRTAISVMILTQSLVNFKLSELNFWKYYEMRKYICDGCFHIIRLLRVLLSQEATIVLRVYVALVWPHLEYCMQVCAPQPIHGHWSELLQIEAVQRLATRSIAGMSGVSYGERLEKLNFTTLLERGMRGDLIETY